MKYDLDKLDSKLNNIDKQLNNIDNNKLEQKVYNLEKEYNNYYLEKDSICGLYIFFLLSAYITYMKDFEMTEYDVD